MDERIVRSLGVGPGLRSPIGNCFNESTPSCPSFWSMKIETSPFGWNLIPSRSVALQCSWIRPIS